MKRIVQILSTVLCFAPTAAFAHPMVGGEATGLGHGFVHPLSGIDHQLAMVLVGVFAYQLGGRALWALPLTFVGVMALGGFLGAIGVGVPFIEAGIAISVIVLGAAVALGIKMPVAAALAATGLFAIFHGHAHGTEMPIAVSGLAFGLGFMLATAVLHAAGIALGYAMGTSSRLIGDSLYRVVGGFSAAIGVLLLAQTM